MWGGFIFVSFGPFTGTKRLLTGSTVNARPPNHQAVVPPNVRIWHRPIIVRAASAQVPQSSTGRLRTSAAHCLSPITQPSTTTSQGHDSSDPPPELCGPTAQESLSHARASANSEHALSTFSFGSTPPGIFWNLAPCFLPGFKTIPIDVKL